MRTNTDYTGPLLNHGKQMYDKLAEEKCVRLSLTTSR